MSGEKQAEIRQAIARIEANIERAEMRKSWRNVDEDIIEEHYEFWLRTERVGGGESESEN